MTADDLIRYCQKGQMKASQEGKGFRFEFTEKFPFNGEGEDEVREKVIALLETEEEEIFERVRSGEARPEVFQVLGLAELRALPPPVWLVKNLLVKDTLAVLYGPPGVGKTFVAAHLALCVASGQAIFNNQVLEGPVVYAIGEGLQSFWRRIDAWIRGRISNPEKKLEENFFVFGDLPNLRDPTHVKEFLRQVLPLKPSLVVIDTLNRALFGGNENSSEDMGLTLSHMDLIRRETGACILPVHHSGKDEKSGARGHSSLKGAVRTEIRVEPGKEELSLVVICEKQSDWLPFERLHLRLEIVTLEEATENQDPVSSCRLFQATTPKGTANDEKILEVFRCGKYPAKLTYTEIGRFSEVKPGSLNRTLNRLVDRDRLAFDGGKYSLIK